MEEINQLVAKELDVKVSQVNATIKLLDDGASVPFIARYRKEATDGLDDIQLRHLEERLYYLRELEDRRQVIIKSISDQDKLTEKLKVEILNASTKNRLEDLYLPYKPKRRTKGQNAIEAGLQPLADALFNDPTLDPQEQAALYLQSTTVDASKKVADEKAALDGARYILMERFSENANLLGDLRAFLFKDAKVFSKVIEGKEKDGEKFRDYFDYTEPLMKVPSHRALAIFRGRKGGFLQISVDLERDESQTNHPCEALIAKQHEIEDLGRAADKWLGEVVRWTWRVKLQTHLENELLSNLREIAEEEAIKVFARNLYDLLMAAPAGPRATLGLDPGLRTGVKVVVVDATGQLVEHATIFPHAPKNQWDESIESLAKLCKKHNVELISIGNGTASRETDQLAAELIKKHSDLTLQKIMVSEAGASIYSASEFASREFPKLDVSFRGAVSIARRLQDPLAELVKIEPKSIGVGQYQHDVNQTRMARGLDAVVEDCVNAVGVDVNTASAPLLARISGLNQTIANNIVTFRDQNGKFADRDRLKEVPRLGSKTFEQAAGFLRIMNGENPLDASSVHPEAYDIVKNIAAKHDRPLQNIVGEKDFLQTVDPTNFTNEKFGLPTITDILSELEKPGRDPRPEFKTAEFKEGVNTLKDLSPNLILEGVVTNVTNFGAFIDIGVHQDGLVHISMLSKSFVKDPHEVVKAGDIVKVKVLEVDIDRKRIGLTMRLEDTPETKKPNQKAANNKSRPAKRKDNTSAGKSQHQKPARSGNKRNKEALPEGKTGTFADLFANAKTLKTKK
ncbi:MAG: RNA-binding transcriptional accessory protein [Pseudomonadales bacterium]|nr:RNA-binding transcriptional accessory protein [Pseudomonadales bacterium]